MNLVGKILTVFVFVAALTFMCFTVAVYATHKNWKLRVDNPGGNPSLSPDILGYEIFRYGLDVIVHFSCRDMNRMGMESRALQLARLGLKNILALTGDYSGKGLNTSTLPYRCP